MMYCLIAENDWEQAKDSDAEAASPGVEGFVHCCDERQVQYVRTTYFAVSSAVVALAIDPTRLSSETRYELGSAGEPERFPHVYGPIHVSEVVGVRRVGSTPNPDADG
jgi:uncharacterized protein (DUF952 family)